MIERLFNEEVFEEFQELSDEVFSTHGTYCNDRLSIICDILSGSSKPTLEAAVKQIEEDAYETMQISLDRHFLEDFSDEIPLHYDAIKSAKLLVTDPTYHSHLAYTSQSDNDYVISIHEIDTILKQSGRFISRLRLEEQHRNCLRKGLSSCFNEIAKEKMKHAQEFIFRGIPYLPSNVITTERIYDEEKGNQAMALIRNSLPSGKTYEGWIDCNDNLMYTAYDRVSPSLTIENNGNRSYIGYTYENIELAELVHFYLDTIFEGTFRDTISAQERLVESVYDAIQQLAKSYFDKTDIPDCREKIPSKHEDILPEALAVYWFKMHNIHIPDTTGNTTIQEIEDNLEQEIDYLYTVIEEFIDSYISTYRKSFKKIDRFSKVLSTMRKRQSFDEKGQYIYTIGGNFLSQDEANKAIQNDPFHYAFQKLQEEISPLLGGFIQSLHLPKKVTAKKNILEIQPIYRDELY